MDEAITKNLFLETRDRAAEVALRKQLQEQERQQKLEAKRKEQEEKLKRIAEVKNEQLLQRARVKAERELQKSKAVIDRRLAQLEQEKARKEEILSKAHLATSRTAQISPKKVFAFGSSTPRELSYLEKLSKDQKQYDRRLAPSTPSSGASPATTPPRDVNGKPQQHARGPKLLLGNNMTSSLYVPQKAKPVAPRASPPKRTEKSPAAKVVVASSKANNNPMTQSLYVAKKAPIPRVSAAARNGSPAKPSPVKRSPTNSTSSTPSQRKPPIPLRANQPTTRPPPKTQPIDKNEPPKAKVIVPRKAMQKQAAEVAVHEPQPTIPVETAPIIAAAEISEAVGTDETKIEDLPPRPISPVAKILESEEVHTIVNDRAPPLHDVEAFVIPDAHGPQPTAPHSEDILSGVPASSTIDDYEEPQVVVYQPEHQPKSLHDELMEASPERIDFGDRESQIIIEGAQPSHDKAAEEIVENIEAKEPLIESNNVAQAVNEHYEKMESNVFPEHSIQSGHNESYSIDDAISGLANLQLQTPQKSDNMIIEQDFVNLDDQTPVAEPQPSHPMDSLDLSQVTKATNFDDHDDKVDEPNGKETSRIESPDHAPFSSSSSAKESDAENTDITRVSEVKKEKVTERKARLSEIMAKVRQGTPPTAAAPASETSMDQSVDAKLLALKLIEQRRQERSATGIENDTTSETDNNHDLETTITANKNNGSPHNGPRLTLAEEMAVANQTKPLDVLPGQPIYDTDYHVLNGKTTPPEDPSHVQHHQIV